METTDSFFDMPAGYNDADLEMCNLEAAGNHHAKMVRRYGEAGWQTLRDGGTLPHPCTSKATGERYTVNIRLVDGEREYSYQGGPWKFTAADARAQATT